MISVALLSRTFHSVRCSGCELGVSLRCGYLASRPGGSVKSSAQPPFGHQPPHGRSRSMVTSRAARSTPVWPPLMTFMRHHAAMTKPGTEADRGHYRNLRCKTVEAYRQVGGSVRSSNGLNGGSNF